jgi:peroxiredoxin
MEEKRSGASHLLSVGDKAPAFSLRDQNGNLVTLEEFKTRKNVVLVFYPGDNTPGCTKQLCAIRDRFELFADNDTVVFGINPQDPASHKKFIIKRSLPFPLLVDGDRKVSAGRENAGEQVSVRGSVVDTRFDAHLPPIYSLLHAKEGKIAIEVLAQLDAHRVRGIALTPTQGLARGMRWKTRAGR